MRVLKYMYNGTVLRNLRELLNIVFERNILRLVRNRCNINYILLNY